MPNINVVYWNLEEFGADPNPSKINVPYKDRCRFIAYAALNMEADIICVTELMGNIAQYESKLRTLQSQLNLIFDKNDGPQGNWYFDYIPSALKDDTNITRDANGYYDSETATFASNSDLEFSGINGRYANKAEGYAVFWNQNVAKFSMSMPPKLRSMNLVTRELGSEWTDNEQSFGVWGYQKKSTKKAMQGDPILDNVDYDGNLLRIACTLPKGTIFPSDAGLKDDNQQTLEDAGSITTAEIDLKSSYTIPKGTIIGKEGVRYNYMDAEFVERVAILIPGLYRLTENYTLPDNGTFIPKHCLSLVMEGRETFSYYGDLPDEDHHLWWRYDNAGIQHNRFWATWGGYPYTEQSATGEDTYTWKALPFGGSGYGFYEKNKYDQNSSTNPKGETEINPIYYWDEKLARLAYPHYKNSSGKLAPFTDLFPDYPYRTERKVELSQAGLLRTRRPAFFTIRVNDANNTLYPITLTHSVNSTARLPEEDKDKKPKKNSNNRPYGNRLATFARSLYEAFDHDEIVEIEPTTEPTTDPVEPTVQHGKYVMAPGMIGGDFNLDFYDPKLTRYERWFAASDYTQTYANHGAHLTFLLENSNGATSATDTMQLKTSIQKVWNDMGADLANVFPANFRTNQNDNVWYPGGVAGLTINDYYEYSYGDINYGYVYDLVMAVVELPDDRLELSRVVEGKEADADETKDEKRYDRMNFTANFPQMPLVALEPFVRKKKSHIVEDLSNGPYKKTYINPVGLKRNQRFINRTDVTLTDVDKNAVTVDLSAAVQAANFVRRYISDHLPVLAPLSFATPDPAKIRVDLSRTIFSTDVTKMEANVYANLSIQFKTSEGEVAENPYLIVVLSSDVGAFENQMDDPKRKKVVAVWDSDSKAYLAKFKFPDNSAPLAGISYRINGRKQAGGLTLYCAQTASLTRSKIVCKNTLIVGESTPVLVTILNEQGLGATYDAKKEVKLSIAPTNGSLTDLTHVSSSIYKATYTAPATLPSETKVTFSATYDGKALTNTKDLTLTKPSN